MPAQYQAFHTHKKVLGEIKKSENADRTLRYFEMITEMLDREADYGSSFPFLESVYNYIAEKEFITDKQCEIVDRIQSQPESIFPNDYYGEQPF